MRGDAAVIDARFAVRGPWSDEAGGGRGVTAASAQAAGRRRPEVLY